MDEKKIKMHLPKIDDLFTTQAERDNINNEKVIELDISNIDDFPNHPFKVVNNEEMKQMSESIKDNGVLVPALVRQKEQYDKSIELGFDDENVSEVIYA